MPGASIPPRVSVIIPTWNRAAYIGAAIESVRAQTFADWELIVVDDGSTDETAEILGALSDPRIRVLRIAHSGTTSIGRNAGIRVAKGEWVAFLDSDDLWLPEKLERQLALMAAQPACDWSYTGLAYIEATGAASPRPPALGKAVPMERRLEALLRFEVTAPIQTMLVRRALLESVGGLDETLPIITDFDLVLRLAGRADATMLPDALTLLRRHPERITSQRRQSEVFAHIERVYRKAAAASDRPAVRALCQRQAARQCASAARALCQEGARAEAVRWMGRALRDAPLAPHVWRAVAGCMIDLVRAAVRRRDIRHVATL